MNFELKPEDCKHLKKSLGNRFYKVAKDYEENKTQHLTQTESTSKRGRRPKMVHNPYYWYFHSLEFEIYPEEIDSLIYGICQLDHYGKGINQEWSLSIGRCKILLKDEYISTTGVMNRFAANKRQAQRYVRAMELIIRFVGKCVKDELIKIERTFRNRIKRDCESIGAVCTDEHMEHTLESMFLLEFCPDGVHYKYNEDVEPVYKPFKGIELTSQY